jgi:hypothetical protein
MRSRWVIGAGIRVVAALGAIVGLYYRTRNCAGGTAFVWMLFIPTALALTFIADAILFGRVAGQRAASVAAVLAVAGFAFVVTFIAGLSGDAAGYCGNF